MLLALIGTLVLAGCVSPKQPGGSLAYVYFQDPDRDDPWSVPISSWQRREKLGEGDAEQPPSSEQPVTRWDSLWADPELSGEPPNLRREYRSFQLETRRAVARGAAAWAQSEARRFYVADGAVDHWPTLEETLDRNGDDCDGLELLVFRFLREMGFEKDRVFRAVVYRETDAQHHMVTLWFETPDDPWVIDPTGIMLTEMRHMSEVPGWVPIKLFSETEEYTVRRSEASGRPPRTPDVGSP